MYSKHLLAVAVCGLVFAASSPVANAAGVFSVDPLTGCKAWNPYPAPEETIRWAGKCEGGLAEGAGTLSYVTPKGRSEYTGFWVAGRMAGRFESRSFDAAGNAAPGGTVGYSVEQAVLGEFYNKSFTSDDAFSVSYYEGGALRGIYRQNQTDNRERAAYLVADGDRNRRIRAVYLARYNPTTRGWSSWPDAETRQVRGFSDYVVVSGDDGRWSLANCANYEDCVAVFRQKLTEFGYAEWPDTRMGRIDADWNARRAEIVAAWAERDKARADAARAKEEHVRMVAGAPADKLFTYASRQEQARRYDWALDAYRTIVEKFPKSKFFDLAAARMPAVQDKLDRQIEQQKVDAMQAEQDRARAEAEVRKAENDAQRLKLEQQRQQDQNQRYQAEQDRQRQQRQVAYDQCTARYEQCSTDCLTKAGGGLIGGIAGLIKPSSVNMAGLNQINQQAQDSCARCDAIQSQCEALKP
ncbi:hypothetical protein ACDA63_12860 [Uliginosibacterium sp. sgz301328]|uniref:hypothetical protein n=1 Tax=Uliginosibacterium sp. sgz301328 TaxID=3243764 RepID=UPI00359DB6DC